MMPGKARSDSVIDSPQVGQATARLLARHYRSLDNWRREMDAAQDPARVESLRRVAAERGLAFFEISSVTGQGLDELRYAMAERVLAPR